MSADEKASVIERVESGSSAKRKVLEERGIAKSTYYRWRAKRSRNEPLTDGNSGKSPWNRLTPQEASSVLGRESVFRVEQASVGIVDHGSQGLLGLRIERLSDTPKRRASKESGGEDGGGQRVPPQDDPASSDVGHRRIVLPSRWGYYYTVTVMDDYSRYVLSHKLQRDMTTDSLIEVIQDSIYATCMTDVPVNDRTKLLSDNG